MIQYKDLADGHRFPVEKKGKLQETIDFVKANFVWLSAAAVAALGIAGLMAMR